jgi:glycerophosphoryl diester phosphodiesterase
VSRPQIIAHRGNSSACHENTMPAFERAVADGADGIEFDLRLTRDRQWIVHHDADVVRDGRRERILSLAAREIAELSVGPTSETILRLDDFLAWARDRRIQLVFDIKDRVGMPELVQAVEQVGLSAPAVFSSFHRKVLKDLEALRPDWPRGLIVGNPRSAMARQFLMGSLLRWSVRHRLTALHLDEHWVVPSSLTRMRDAGFRLAVWTVDDPVRLTLLAALGIDAIITNRPDLACITLRGKAETQE